MYITRLSDVKKVKLEVEGAEKTWKQIPLGGAEGVPVFSFRVFTIEPGGHTPYHEHPFEHMNYVIEGEGALMDKDGKDHPVKKGDFILVKPGEKHCYKNTAKSGNMIVICGVPKEYE